MILRSALLALFLALPGAAAAQNEVDPWITRVVEGYRAELGRQDSRRTMRVRDVRGERRTVILDVELTPDSSPLLRSENVLSVFAAAFCADAEAAGFFNEGRRLRVDVVREGRQLGSAATDRCLGPIGEGMSAATFAGAFQSFVGQEDGGVRLASVRAEGSVLIIVLEMLPGSSLTGEAAIANFVAGFCLRPGMDGVFFDRGLTMRVDATRSGRGLVQSRPITRCPVRQ